MPSLKTQRLIEDVDNAIRVLASRKYQDPDLAHVVILLSALVKEHLMEVPEVSYPIAGTDKMTYPVPSDKWISRESARMEIETLTMQREDACNLAQKLWRSMAPVQAANIFPKLTKEQKEILADGQTKV